MYLQDLAEFHLLTGGGEKLEVTAAFLPESGDTLNAIGTDGVTLFLAVSVICLAIGYAIFRKSDVN